jgi:hypothetical protein
MDAVRAKGDEMETVTKAQPQQISYGTAKCGHAGQIFKTGLCAHCYILYLENIVKHAPPRFDTTWCSQCGSNFGPGHHGFSRCDEHTDKPLAECQWPTCEKGAQEPGFVTALRLTQQPGWSSEMIAYIDALKAGTNYVADDAVLPTTVIFSNGRTVKIVDGHLVVGWER